MGSLPLWLYLFLLAAQGSDPIPPAEAARAFAEAEEAALADGGRLWGVELLGPLLLADPVTRSVVANQPDEAGKLVERDGVFLGTLPPEVGIANTAVEWGGVRWTMVRWPLSERRHARVRLLMHESFHRIQPQLRHAGGDPLNLHLDTQVGRTWLRLEFRALAEALVRRDELRKRAAADALLFRAQRRALFSEARAKESSFERNEGLAEYTGLRLSGLPEWVLADRAAVKLEQDEAAPSQVRSFAYATGPAYGILLDELGVAWRADVGAESDLSDLLAAALGWKAPTELEEAARARLGPYDGAAVLAAEVEVARRRSEQDARNRARFVDGPVVVLPFGSSVRYTFDPDRITPLEGVGSVYASTRVVEAWGVLDASASGALFLSDESGRMVGARVPSPPQPSAPPSAGDGWTLELAPGWELVPGERAGDWKAARTDE